MALVSRCLTRVGPLCVRVAAQRSLSVTSSALVHQIDLHPIKHHYYQHPEEDLNKLPKPHHVMVGEYRTEEEHLANGEWPWNEGIRSRLPEHFKQRYIENFTVQPIPVHYRPEPGRWKPDMYGTLGRVENVPIPVVYPRQADEGLWGGEGLVEGLRKKKDKHIKPKTPRVWKPKLVRRVFYSEILDKHMAITCTLRLLDLVDEACGFDNYILNTHQVDMKSKLGMMLKREMLSALVHKSLYPNDSVKRDEIYERYIEHIVPAEEVEWIGLTLEEAEKKQLAIEETERQSAAPLKEILAMELIEKLKNPPKESDEDLEVESSGWLSKLNPFKE